MAKEGDFKHEDEPRAFLLRCPESRCQAGKHDVWRLARREEDCRRFVPSAVGRFAFAGSHL
jgi:hypothetical protein